MRYLCFAVFFCSFFVSKHSFALSCYAVVGGQELTTETARVDDIIIPESSSDDSIIWKSPTYTRTIKCNEAGVSEFVYFYPFPNITLASLPQGMIFGIVYNGTSYDLTSSGMKIKTNIYVTPGSTQTGVINVQVYIKKKGVISGGYNGILPIYQLDGQGGLNNSPTAKNYKFNLSNLEHITTGSCDYTFNSNHSANQINVDDNLISNGQIINSIGLASISCMPMDVLKNRTANISLYTTDSLGGNYFSTDKDGLNYQLIMSGSTITPSVTSGSPLTVPLKLNSNAKGTLTFDQKVSLLSTDNDWLYQNSEITATSKNPNLKMNVHSFE